jgi:hypothetical protein
MIYFTKITHSGRGARVWIPHGLVCETKIGGDEWAVCYKEDDGGIKIHGIRDKDEIRRAIGIYRNGSDKASGGAGSGEHQR